MSLCLRLGFLKTRLHYVGTLGTCLPAMVFVAMRAYPLCLEFWKSGLHNVGALRICLRRGVCGYARLCLCLELWKTRQTPWGSLEDACQPWCLQLCESMPVPAILENYAPLCGDVWNMRSSRGVCGHASLSLCLELWKTRLHYVGTFGVCLAAAAFVAIRA